jgi:hypothetical protein
MDEKRCPHCGQIMSKELQEELLKKKKIREAREDAIREEEDRREKEFQKKIEDYPVGRDGFVYDPKEKDPKYRDIIKKAEKEAEDILEKEFSGFKNELGYCHSLWDKKKKILKEKYGIDWMTPKECNPFTMFD